MIDDIHPEEQSSIQRSRRRKAANTDALKIDRLPPHSIEAEQGVLGCILLSPADCMNHCIQVFSAGSDVFYDLRHRVIYELFFAMFDSKEAMDMITISQRLKDKNQLEGVGGVAYLSSLMDAVPSAANLEFYIGIVKEKFILRRMIHTCTDVVAQVYEHEGEITGLLDQFETDALAIGDLAQKQNEIVPVKELVRGAIMRLEQRILRPKEVLGIPTGFPDIDFYMKGMKAGQMIVIAARPSIGKTSLAMNIGENVAISQKLSVGVFSLEMPSDELIDRMAASMSKVNLNRLTESDCERMTVHLSKLAAAPLYIDDTAGLSIMQLRARARRMVQRYGVKLFIIDYLQLMSNSSKRGENRQAEVTQISNGVKQMAKELKVPVIVLSQLNRELEREKNRKPRLSDLRESGSIEQDADFVGMLYNTKTEEELANLGETVVPVNMVVAKNRNGGKGEVHLTFLKEFTRFESCARVWVD